MRTFMYFYRAWSLMYYKAALRSLQQRNPAHPDIPEIVLKISELREQ